MVFFIVTAFAIQFISHAGALQFSPGDKPPAYFPVIAYDGDRTRPDAKRYRVMSWSEWEKLAAEPSGVGLLLPEMSGKLTLGDNNNATFTATPDGEARQAIDLHWTAGNIEQQARYAARERAIEPQYYRTISSNTLLLGAAAGFIAGLFVGRALRRRWLAQPGYLAPRQ
jgi:hypothetical protein